MVFGKLFGLRGIAIIFSFGSNILLEVKCSWFLCRREQQNIEGKLPASVYIYIFVFFFSKNKTMCVYFELHHYRFAEPCSENCSRTLRQHPPPDHIFKLTKHAQQPFFFSIVFNVNLYYYSNTVFNTKAHVVNTQSQRFDCVTQTLLFISIYIYISIKQ